MTVLLDLDERGSLLDPATGAPVGAAAVPDALHRLLRVPREATDIVVFVHGWRTSRKKAERKARRFFGDVLAHWETTGDRYPALPAYRPYNVIVRWPSMSPWGRRGYERIRDRAHAMTTRGEAAAVIAQLLGYLNRNRRPPGRGPARLRTAAGQYLHCAGHSFGGRFLCQAIQEAADPRRPPTLDWPWRDAAYPYTVDSLLVFQMAARPDCFATIFPRLLGDAPINCPIVLTRSDSDRAAGLWHRRAEGVAGIGSVGADAPPGRIGSIRLHRLDEDYGRSELESRIVNVDASWRYRGGSWPSFTGAHSAFWHAESMHLFLSLVALAR
ncbi:hypothetical protein AGRA3207_002152 [Actinomadura graeca]|uniref:Alpha/beta hydrolase n=1 Tax=Actinomadura graeca TaxID=2750812 RepID=A0ABX8QRA6_9ACTN|nr:hypothetical protein [Actinomadura graeca]QXJ21313.1 hypothetical protein AGRA3207_002152 [Actinomadura graeca]